MADVDRLDLLAQELGFALKSEQREALESLLRGNDVFCVLATGFGKSLIYQMFTHYFQPQFIVGWRVYFSLICESIAAQLLSRLGVTVGFKIK